MLILITFYGLYYVINFNMHISIQHIANNIHLDSGLLNTAVNEKFCQQLLYLICNIHLGIYTISKLDIIF